MVRWLVQAGKDVTVWWYAVVYWWFAGLGGLYFAALGCRHTVCNEQTGETAVVVVVVVAVSNFGPEPVK